ncbi:MAG: cyclic nucleotide-binding domain-containing protein [Hyphomicrobiales bacterium]|nr:cyclic nucleotide-binding domain-containing protein [Hyphomicrobiales bacterium]
MEKTGLDLDLFERIGARPVQFQQQQTIFSEGETGKVMFLVRNGEVALSIDGDTVATLWPGDIFGEMAMIDGSPRSASAVAQSAVDALVIDRDTFLAIVREAPEFAMHLLTILSVRVRELNCLV